MAHWTFKKKKKSTCLSNLVIIVSCELMTHVPWHIYTHAHTHNKQTKQKNFKCSYAPLTKLLPHEEHKEGTRIIQLLLNFIALWSSFISFERGLAWNCDGTELNSNSQSSCLEFLNAGIVRVPYHDYSLVLFKCSFLPDMMAHSLESQH